VSIVCCPFKQNEESWAGRLDSSLSDTVSDGDEFTFEVGLQRVR
jgi:hypothetical protein